MAMRLSHPLRPSSLPQFQFRPKSLSTCKFSIQNRISNSDNSRKLVMEVKEKLEKDQHSLPVGRNGRDDEDMILWFLKGPKKWRQEFGVSELHEESVRIVAETGKAYMHDFLDVNDRPVLIVVASKHFPAMQDPIEDEKLWCVSD
ncbi:hypothetical protein CK203_072719 [Vitis vinifera]|uniref:Uncharacterized protein n=1 Tax=Vitis vinifera TaxID=29760 RepID=A0A438EYZ2_VITVI|nr:hypothetical protein CK203_072719 [Vitis vinifera]